MGFLHEYPHKQRDNRTSSRLHLLCLTFTGHAAICYRQHGLTDAKLDQINTDDNYYFMKCLSPHKQATTVKLIHDWIPTYAFLHKQQHYPSPLSDTTERHSHILECPEKQATTTRVELLVGCLRNLTNMNTSIYILSTIEYKFSLTINTT